MGKNELYVEKAIEICGGLPLSIQINSDQHLYTKKLLKAEEIKHSKALTLIVLTLI